MLSFWHTQKFAMVLFFTIVQATIGSFVVFLTLTDVLGPSQPTYMVDQWLAKCCVPSLADNSAQTIEKSSHDDTDPNKTERTATQNVDIVDL